MGLGMALTLPLCTLVWGVDRVWSLAGCTDRPQLGYSCLCEPFSLDTAKLALRTTVMQGVQLMLLCALWKWLLTFMVQLDITLLNA